jgi:general L-amino acid transport system substrate-binding protein
VSSANLAEMQGGTNPNIQRLLGETGELGAMLGLPNDFAAKVIAAVGNYGEIYDRAFGPDTSLALERGLNELWTNGGLMYSPPFR